MRASPVILNEVKHLLHLNEEILRCALLDFQETTRNEFYYIQSMDKTQAEYSNLRGIELPSFFLISETFPQTRSFLPEMERSLARHTFDPSSLLNKLSHDSNCVPLGLNFSHLCGIITLFRKTG